MGSEHGWIKLHRCITDNWVWSDKPFSKGQAWIDMLLMANHEPHRLKTKTGFVDIDRGSFHTEERSLMSRWGWSNSKVRNFIRCLVSEKMIAVTVKKSTTGKSTEGTTVKVLNYRVYQGMLNEKSSGNSAKEVVENQHESNEKSKQECKNERTLVSAVHLRLAELLNERITAWLPNAKVPANLDTWANELRLAMVQDGRTEQELESVIRWATADSFWRGNILSAKKLREKFDQLQGKMMQAKPAQPAGRDYSKLRM